MADTNPKLVIEVESHRELYVRVSGTPESLRSLAASLASAVDALPSPLTNRQAIYPKDFGFADASRNKRETYLSFHAEPSLDYLGSRQKRYTFRDFVFCCVLVIFIAFAIIGIRTVWHWII